MIVGFTGTRQGMTSRQHMEVYHWMIDADPISQVHHGDCVGADQHFDALADLFDFPITVHPPDDDRARAFCDGPNHTILKPKPYIVRNHDIVDACDVLIACPSGPEKLRSGTWATIRYARKIGKEVIIIYPNEVT